MFSTILLSALAVLTVAAPTDNTVVRSSTGYYTGIINSTFPKVRAFVNVPYGQTTAGQNRFMPPLAAPLSSDHFDATKYPPACPQYVTATKTIWNQKIPQYLQYWGVTNLSAGVSAPFASEDCLRLAIWTPANATSASLLPVAMVTSLFLSVTQLTKIVLDRRRLSNQRYPRSWTATSTMGKQI